MINLISNHVLMQAIALNMPTICGLLVFAEARSSPVNQNLETNSNENNLPCYKERVYSTPASLYFPIALSLVVDDIDFLLFIHQAKITLHFFHVLHTCISIVSKLKQSNLTPLPGSTSLYWGTVRVSISTFRW